MESKKRSQLILGIILILGAIYLIASRFIPGLRIHLMISTWRGWLIFISIAILLIGMLTGTPGLAVPACIVAGIGGILYFQNEINTPQAWAAWSYLWTLIPGFAGVGVLISALLRGSLRKDFGHSLNLIVSSVVLFTIFGILFGGWTIFGPYTTYLPIALLLLLGIWLILRGAIRVK